MLYWAFVCTDNDLIILKTKQCNTNLSSVSTPKNNLFLFLADSYVCQEWFSRGLWYILGFPSAIQTTHFHRRQHTDSAQWKLHVSFCEDNVYDIVHTQGCILCDWGRTESFVNVDSQNDGDVNNAPGYFWSSIRKYTIVFQSFNRVHCCFLQSLNRSRL